MLQHLEALNVAGARGPAVVELQRLLSAVGASTSGGDGLSRDGGTYGTKTQLWVKQFQLAEGISPANGKVDATTARALSALASARAPVFSTRDAAGHRTTYAGALPSLPKGARPDGVTPLNQNNNPRVPLGDQKGMRANLQDQGCVVTSFAMIASRLTGHAVTPAALNDDKANFLKGSDQFSSLLAVKGFGLTSTPMSLSDPGAEQALLAAVDSGEGVMLRVDFVGDKHGDHTVVLTGRTGNTLRGIDPATGGPVEMRIDTEGRITGAGWRRYQGVAFTIIGRAEAASTNWCSISRQGR